jgi:hypothetical protein
MLVEHDIRRYVTWREESASRPKLPEGSADSPK